MSSNVGVHAAELGVCILVHYLVASNGIGPVCVVRVDADDFWWSWHQRTPSDEALWVFVIGLVERFLANDSYAFNAVVMDITRRKKRQSAMAMRVVIPGYEITNPGSGVFERGETCWIVGLVLERAKMGLRKGVVV